VTRRAGVPAALMATGVLAAVACAHTGAFDRSLRAGRWQDAAAEFRADSALQRNATALRRAARIHAVPDSVTWDPDRALELLARARALAPRARVEDADSRLEAMLEYVVRERAARGAQMIVLRDSLAGAAAEVTRLRAELAELRETNAAHESERAVLERMVSRLEADLRDRETQISALRSELDRLKEIDLARSSRPRH
jgi:hypothetical protein